MKCPSCSKNHQHKYGMKCRCGYKFALDPKVDKISDRRFVSFINGASCNGTFSFTENQLYTAACRKQLSLHVALPIFLTFLTAGFLFLGFAFEPKLLFVAIVPTLVLLGCLYHLFLGKLPRDRFEGWRKKYIAEHGPIKSMIIGAKLKDPPKQMSEPDIHDYGVERVLVVQRRILVDLLIANNIHSANRALIVTADGYPDYLSQRVQELLAESSELPVFLLHDSDHEGMSWAAEQMVRYQAPRRQVIDLGLAPESVKKIGKLSTLRLKNVDYKVPIDAVPMAMLANGIALSMDQGIGMEELLVMDTTTDASTSFG